MQIAIIYDCGQLGRNFITNLSDKYGAAIYHDQGDGEVLYRIDDVRTIINDIVPHLGVTVNIFFVGSDEEDMEQFLSL